MVVVDCEPVVGANIEDQMKAVAEAAAQVESILKVAESEGVELVLNDRTDVHVQLCHGVAGRLQVGQTTVAAMTEQIEGNPVDRFLAEISGGTGISPDVFTAESLLDATVPGWRFEMRGAESVAAQFSHWYAGPVAIERSNRLTVPGGEVVEIDLSGEHDGVPYAAHQVHLITVADGRISADTVFCGGRWSADRLAEMEAARAR